MQPVKIGDRITLTAPMLNDPCPIEVGDVGTVNWVGDWETPLTRQIGVKWDSGRTLGLVDGDQFTIIGHVNV